MMTSTINTERQQQLRKVAILVATLDEPLAARLLADLPAREAAAVEQIVEQLDDIDPAEYQAVVADFRQGIAEPPPRQIEPPHTQLEGVELDESLLARLADTSHALPTTGNNAGPWQALSDTDAATLVEMLSAEQPQTIAVVLSRLETARAAELIGKLSPALQAEVLTRLADLDPADEQTLQVVASQLAGWINEQRRRQQRMAAGCDLVQRILQSTPAGQRTTMLAQLGKHNPGLAEKLSSPSAHQTVTRETARLSAMNQWQATEKTTYAAPETYVDTAAEPVTPTNDPLSELESLDDAALLKALRLSDRQTVMLALAGASEGLMKRIVRGLPRRRANQFRQQVRSIGPTRLSEMLAAQRELVRHAQS